jgi:hypothetical protein
MEPTMRKKFRAIEERLAVENLESNLTRARSITVGTAFGGTSEISMRANNGSTIYCIMQPVEIIELIHQLAANTGCHIQLTPRRDFASWRDWKYTEAELEHYRGQQHLPGVGHPPHVNDMAPHAQLGANLPHPEQQPGMPMMENSGGETMAVEKSSDDGAADGATDAS